MHGLLLVPRSLFRPKFAMQIRSCQSFPLIRDTLHLGLLPNLGYSLSLDREVRSRREHISGCWQTSPTLTPLHSLQNWLLVSSPSSLLGHLTSSSRRSAEEQHTCAPSFLGDRVTRKYRTGGGRRSFSSRKMASVGFVHLGSRTSVSQRVLSDSCRPDIGDLARLTELSTSLLDQSPLRTGPIGDLSGTPEPDNSSVLFSRRVSVPAAEPMTATTLTCGLRGPLSIRDQRDREVEVVQLPLFFFRVQFQPFTHFPFFCHCSRFSRQFSHSSLLLPPARPHITDICFHC